jgi:hypothetical protein
MPSSRTFASWIWSSPFTKWVLRRFLIALSWAANGICGSPMTAGCAIQEADLVGRETKESRLSTIFSVDDN